MEKIPKIKLPIVKLYLDDLERIEKILKDIKLKDNEVSIIRFITDNNVFDNIIKLQDFSKKAINNLEIRYYILEKEEEKEFEFDLTLLTDIAIIIKEAEGEINFCDYDNQKIIYSAVDTIKDYILRNKIIGKRNIIILKYKKEDSFWKRKPDEIKLMIVGAFITIVVEIISAIILLIIGVVKI